MNIYLNRYKYKYIFLLIAIYYFKTYSSNKSLRQIRNYINDNLLGKLYYSTSYFIKENSPIISIIIATFNGEVFLKPVVRSVQNQNFSNIEIIIVDDGSMDNSIKVIKELMKEDNRIKLIRNIENRGTLYSKTRGILNSKGKYVMTLDHDDLYARNNVFSILFNEAEKYNLDLLGFASMIFSVETKYLIRKNFINYFKTSIIKKPNIKKRFLNHNIKQSGTLLCMYFIKKSLFLKVINLLGKEFINRNIDAHDDTILMFLLSRNALSLKHLKDIFHVIFIWPKKYSISLSFHHTIKFKERERKNCYSFLTFSEILLLFTENNKNDKKIASNHFIQWYFKIGKCHYKKDIIKDMNNKYIAKSSKYEILSYLQCLKN